MRKAKATGQALYEALQDSNPGYCQDSWADAHRSVRQTMIVAERKLHDLAGTMQSKEPGQALYEALHESDPNEYSESWETLATVTRDTMAAAEQSWRHPGLETPASSSLPGGEGAPDSSLGRWRKAIGAQTDKWAGFAMTLVFLLMIAEVNFGIFGFLFSLLFRVFTASDVPGL